MKKFILSGLVIAMALLTSTISFAQKQQKTAYEQRVATVGSQFLKELGYSGSQVNEFLYSSIEEQELMLGLASMGAYPEQRNKLKAQLAAARKLKTAVDIKREKEREKKAQDKREKERAEKAANEEAARKRQAQAEYEATDAGQIRKNIKSEFEKWSEKGEFEKQVDYESRLQNQSQKTFEKICMEEIQQKTKEYCYRAGCNIKTDLSTYNSEKETFAILFEFNKIKWQNELNVSIADAENFKNNWKYEVGINDCDWCFIDNALCPTLITLVDEEDNPKYEFKLPLTNQSEISYSFDDFGIENPHLKGYVFRYDEVINNNPEFERIYSYVDVAPAFPGGNQEIDAWIKKRWRIEQFVDEYCFIVEKDGTLSGVTRHKRDFYDAVRLIKEMPRWSPGTKNGIPVRTKFKWTVKK